MGGRGGAKILFTGMNIGRLFTSVFRYCLIRVYALFASVNGVLEMVIFLCFLYREVGRNHWF